MSIIYYLVERKELEMTKDIVGINEKLTSMDQDTLQKSNNFDDMAVGLTESGDVNLSPKGIEPTTLVKDKRQHDCAKVDKENAELRRKLLRTRRALEDTFEKMRTANECKLQIEKNIKTQILKTQNVLKNVAVNIQNEL